MNILYLFNDIEHESIVNGVNKCYFNLECQSVSESIKVRVASKCDVIIVDEEANNKLQKKGLDLLRKLNDDPKVILVSDTIEDDSFDLVMGYDIDIDKLTDQIHELLPDKVQKCANDLLICHQENIKLDKNTKVVQKDNEVVYLSKSEFRLLELFLENKNKELEREDIKKVVCNENANHKIDSIRIVDVYVKNLRRKANVECIKSVKGVGYVWEVDAQ